MSDSSRQPSYEELAALVVGQADLLAGQASRLAELTSRVRDKDAVIEAMRVELAGLRRQVGRDSSNSSQPPSMDGIGAKAAKRSGKLEQQAASDDSSGAGHAAGGSGALGRRNRKQGGQPGHRGSGLARVAKADRSESVEPVGCAGCGGDLTGAPGGVAWSVQVFDLPALALSVTEYLLMRRACACGRVTTADLPAGVRGGPACYGPNVTAAATWLAAQDVIGVQRAAEMMSALLGASVSSGFVSSCLARLDDCLTAAGFEQELKAALGEQDVLGTDETPAPVTASGAAAQTAKTGEDISNPHVFTMRTMHAYTRSPLGIAPTDLPGDLVWYGAAGTRTKKAISAFGILDQFRGVLVRDDFGGYLSYDRDLAGVQQCLSHLLRHLQDVTDIDPHTQIWTGQATDALRLAMHTINTARREDATVDPAIIARARHSYDQAVAYGISINLSRPWPKGNHPGLVLARRLKRKADQVWLFTTRPDVPATNNGSETAIRGFKLAEKVSGCWRTLATLQRHCRIRSYLVSARNHAHRPLDAIRAALNGTPWMPPRKTTAYAA